MTGQKPFDGEHAAEVVRHQAFDEPIPARQLAPERISTTMAKIIECAMAKDREQRFSNAMEMFDALMRREQELVVEGVISGRATYFPGSEVTGSRPIATLNSPDSLRFPHPAELGENGPTITLQKRSVMLMVAGAIFVFLVMIAMIMFLVITN